ncbi:hypothetical protein N431DRAFT_79944 [Stipitochalara longipes BDJ]|nr:hypothetical protein N431DRAFT_79944 [Stipitochalara longipes BDJ]
MLSKRTAPELHQPWSWPWSLLFFFSHFRATHHQTQNVSVHPLQSLASTTNPHPTSAKAENMIIRTNRRTLSKASSSLLKPFCPTPAAASHSNQKVDSMAWRLDTHYRSTGWLSVSPTSHRLQSFRASHQKI